MTAVAPELNRQLGLLEGAGLIRLLQHEPDLEYLFRHVLVQEAAYDSLLKQERRELHRRVAETLERLFPDRREELAAVIALHYEAAGVAERAIEYLRMAAEHAMHRGADHEARDFLDRAAALMPPGDDPETRRLRAEIGLGRVEAGRNFVPADESLALLADVRADAEALRDDALLARTFLLIALERTMRGEQYATSPELSQALDRALELADASDLPDLRGFPLGVIGEARFHAGEFEDAIEALSTAIPLLERHRRAREASLFGGTLAMAHAHLGNFREALAEVERSRRLAVESNDPTAMLDADLMRGMIEALRGDGAAAIEYATRAAERADVVDNKSCAIVARSVIGDQHLRSGRTHEAIEAFESVATLSAFCALAPVKLEASRALLDSARAVAAGARLPVERFDAALKLAETSGDRISQAEILRQRARFHAIGGAAIGSATRDYQAAEGILESIGARAALAQTLSEHADAVERAGEAAQAAALRRRAADLLSPAVHG